jgi:hypothetical protein
MFYNAINVHVLPKWKSTNRCGTKARTPSYAIIHTYTHQVTPVSVFDETLWEDPGVNRLQDSINKCDLLHRKLKQGISLKKYVKSYGERPNDVTSAVKC